MYNYASTREINGNSYECHAMYSHYQSKNAKTIMSTILRKSVVSEWVQCPYINLSHLPTASKRANISSNNSLRCSTSGSPLGTLSLCFENFYAQITNYIDNHISLFYGYLRDVKAFDGDTNLPCLFRRSLRATMYRELASKRWLGQIIRARLPS